MVYGANEMPSANRTPNPKAKVRVKQGNLGKVHDKPDDLAAYSGLYDASAVIAMLNKSMSTPPKIFSAWPLYPPAMS